MLLAIFNICLIFGAYQIFPVYTTITPKILMSTNTIELELLGKQATLTIHRYDIFHPYQHYVRFEGNCEIDGLNINVTTDTFRLDKIISEYANTQSIIPDEYKYWWDGILFVQAPGPPERWIKYDHPDNYDTYYPGIINEGYVLEGNSRLHLHIPQHVLETAKEGGTLTSVISACVAVVAAALAIPEPIISKVTAGVIALIAAILTAVGIVIYWFISDVIQTELGDGWSWLWDFGSWWLFKWWRQSFGRWRGWGWLFVVANSGSVSPKVPRGPGAPVCYFL